MCDNIELLEDQLSIGIFDSGVGGLTVLRRIAERMPDESIIYLGDTARVPYGTKSHDTVVRYAMACANILLERGVKLIVVACNTASAFALDVLQDELDVPVLGVIEPGARSAVAASRNGRIGIIGTAGTMASGQYQHAVHSISPDAKVFCKACPLFVPLAEEGWTEGEVPTKVAEEYLSELIENDIDTLILGCTHYPLLKGVIKSIIGDEVKIVDSAESTSVTVEEVVNVMGMAQSGQPRLSPRLRLLVSDAPNGFSDVGKRFLGHDLPEIEWVDF